MIYLPITTVLQQRWLARLGYLRRLRVHPDALEDLLDSRTVGDKGNTAHTATALGVQQWEQLKDASDQHCPQVVSW